MEESSFLHLLELGIIHIGTFSHEVHDLFDTLLLFVELVVIVVIIIIIKALFFIFLSKRAFIFLNMIRENCL